MTIHVTEPFVVAEQSEAAAKIRATLAGQELAAKVESATARFGLVQTWQQIHAAIRTSIPRRFFKPREVRCRQIGDYRRFIPDAALLIYEDAKATGAFSEFCVAWPSYEAEPAPDPWLLGWTQYRGSNRHFHTNSERAIVLAYWDDAVLHPKRVARA